MGQLMIKAVLFVVSKMMWSIKVKNKWRLPSTPFILALGPHRTEIESLLVMVSLWSLPVRFFAKAEYWKQRSLMGWVVRWSHQIPLERLDPRKANEAIDIGAYILANTQGIVALYPEGTRNKNKGDARIHKGHTGVVRTALRANALASFEIPIVPVGLIGFDEVKMPGHGYQRVRATMVIGEPIYLSHHTTRVEQHLPERAREVAVSTRMTKHLMETLAELSGTQYAATTLPISGSDLLEDG